MLRPTQGGKAAAGWRPRGTSCFIVNKYFVAQSIQARKKRIH
jgi:hypothetical protein